MKTLRMQVLEHAARMPEGSPIHARALLHFGSRAAIDQTLSRLTRTGKLLRAGRGMYVRPIKTRFGTRAPSPHKIVEQLAELHNEAVAPNGAAAANALGLTTQVPTLEQYLTSGRTRRLKLGGQIVEMKHAPAWQFARPGRPGVAIRALAWLGPEQAPSALSILKQRLSRRELREISSAQQLLPQWLAKTVGEALASNG